MDVKFDADDEILKKLWVKFTWFRTKPTPTPEARGQLPIIPRTDIEGQDLKDYLNQFIKRVWIPGMVSGRCCEYVDLCIWDPFRNDSPDNWALINADMDEEPEKEIKQDKILNRAYDDMKKSYRELQSSLKTYMEVLEGKKFVAVDASTGLKAVFDPESLKGEKTENDRLVIQSGDETRVVTRGLEGEGTYTVIFDPANAEWQTSGKQIKTFYLLYKYLKKEILTIKLSGNEDPYSEQTKRLYEDIAGVNDLDISDQLKKVIDAHQALAPKGEQRYVHYIPSLFYPEGSGTGIGGLMLITRHKLRDETLAKFQTVIDSILSKIGIYYLFDNFFDQSVRSAISSIMARNMSHNIGSHVIPRATIDAVKRRLEELGLWPDGDGGIRLLSSLKGTLDEYTQRKSDFLAEITTEPLMTTRPAFFYRELILPLIENALFMDNIAANESVRYVDAETNRLRIRVFINEHELEAVYKCAVCPEAPGGPPYSTAGRLPYSMTCREHKHQRLEIKEIRNGEHDVEIELPGPLGEFALYSFLENYIRNVAKHNKAMLQKGGDLEVSIDIKDLGDLDFYNIKITNNVIDPNQPVNITIDGKTYTSLQRAITRHIESKVIQPDGALKRQAWGIGEMKICAALLMGPKDFVTIIQGKTPSAAAALEEAAIMKAGDEPTAAPNKLSPSHPEPPLSVLVEEIRGAPRLVYDFRLMKSKKICAVLPGWPMATDEERARVQQLRSEGIWIYKSVADFRNGFKKSPDDIKKKGGQRDTIASFRFAVFDCSKTARSERRAIVKELCGELPGEHSAFLTQLPFRVLVLTGDTGLKLRKNVQPVAATQETSGILNMDGGEFQRWVWVNWMRRWLDEGSDERNAIVNIYLEQRGDENPTDQWAKYADAFNRSSDHVKVKVYETGAGNEVTSLTKVEDDGTSVNLIYDRHRRLRNEFDTHFDRSRDWSYVMLEKQSPDFATLFAPKFPSQPEEYWALPWELAEAGLLRVLVIDERAAEFSFEKLSEGPLEVALGLLKALKKGEVLNEQALKWHLAWAARVYICTHFGYRQKAQPLHETVRKKESDFPYLKVELGEDTIDYRLSIVGQEENSLDVDAVLIHQGILDELRNRNEDFDQDRFLRGLRERFPFVVVESGRGIPPNLSDNEKFLPFSLLQHNILGENVGKFGLTRTLMSLARRCGRKDP